MISITGIFKQTVKASLRSKVFYFLLVLSLLAAIAIPLAIKGDGTAIGAVQAGLTYSLQSVGWLLSLAAVWLGCAGVSRELENYNLHLVLTKPVPAWKLWVGKYLGVFAITLLPLLICAITVYSLTLAKLTPDNFSEVELDRAKKEILVGRRTYAPNRPDFNALARKRYEEMRVDGRLAPDHDKAQVLNELLRQAKAGVTEVASAKIRRWRFSGIRREKDSDRLFFRYRLYVARTSDSSQRETVGVWRFVNPALEGKARGEAYLPRRSMGGSFHEIAIPFSLVGDKGELTVEYGNRDPRQEPVIFQLEDGPRLLVPAASFAVNYASGMFVMSVRIALFTLLGCAMGAMFSSPVAVFIAMTYLLLSVLADAVFRDAADSINSATGRPYGYNIVSYASATAVDALVISLREFDVPGKLAGGRLIGVEQIARVTLLQFTLRGLPLAALSIFILGRRELGKIIRR